MGKLPTKSVFTERAVCKSGSNGASILIPVDVRRHAGVEIGDRVDMTYDRESQDLKIHLDDQGECNGGDSRD